MADTTYSNVQQTTTINLRVIEDVCSPQIDVSNINLQSSYSYTLGDAEELLVDVADFSCNDCQALVTVYYLDDTDTLVAAAGVFLDIQSPGRQWSNVGQFSNIWELTTIGQLNVNIQTDDATLVGT